MDKNNPAPQAPQPLPVQPIPNIQPSVQPGTLQPNTPQTSAPVADPSSGGSNKIVLWFVVGLVLIILLVGGIYFYLSKQQAEIPQSQTPNTPAAVVEENLEEDLNNINVDTSTSSSDLTTIDEDLQQL